MKQIRHEPSLKLCSRIAIRSKIRNILLLAIALFLLFSILSQEVDASPGVETSLSIDVVEYDSSSQILNYSGISDQELVNIRVMGSNYSSQLTAEKVSPDGHFSGSIKLNLSGPAVYRIYANAGGSTVSKQFVVTSGDVQFTILSASYDFTTGLIDYAGVSDSNLVNIRLVGTDYHSPVVAESIDKGCFTGSLYVGQLINGTYYLKATDESGKIQSKQISVGQDGLSITSVDYDLQSGIVSYSGLSDSDLVNVRVFGEGFISQVDAEVVKSGLFAGSMKIGKLNTGEYRLIINNGNVTISKPFVVDIDVIEITELYVDYSDLQQKNWKIQFKGRTLSTNLSISIKGDGVDVEPVPIDVKSGIFEGDLSLKGMNPGRYSMIVTDGHSHIIKEFTIASEDEEITDKIGNVMTNYGRTLVRFSGKADTYVIPENVEQVLNDAFRDSKIDKFIYDREREWDIFINDRFPLEDCEITNIEIKDGISVIPDYLFAKTSITELTIPKSVERIGVKSFYACSELNVIVVQDNNRLTLIDTYAFGGTLNGAHVSSKISSVTFGTSEDGYSCDIGTGAFFLCDSLKEVILHDGFNLRSIGNVAFAKKNDNSDGSKLEAINFNCENGVLIPKEVEEIGWLAFSIVRSSLCSSSGNEPGINVYKYQFPSIYPKFAELAVQPEEPKLSQPKESISFESESVISTINEGAFAGYYTKSIDLSMCHGLKVIKNSAFGNCLADDGTLALPSSVEELYQAFSRSSGNGHIITKGYLDITIPASVKICASSFNNVSKTIVAEDNSKLIEYSGSHTDDITDLTNCVNLKTVRNSTNVKLLPGVYDLKNIGYDVSMSVAVYDGPTKTMTISSDTMIIPWNEVIGAGSIVFSADYDAEKAYVKEIEGILYFCKDGKFIVLKNLGGEIVRLCPNASIMDNSLDESVVKIEMNEGISLSSGAFKSCTNLKTINMHFSPSDVGDLIEALVESKSKPTLFIDGFIQEPIVSELNRWTTVYQGYAVARDWIYLNSSADGYDLHYNKGVDDSVIIKTELDLSRYILECHGCIASLNDGVITIQFINHDVSHRSIDVVLNPLYKTYVSIKLDYGGGQESNGKNSTIIDVFVGSSFGEVSLPEIRYDCHTLIGWEMIDGTMISDDFIIERDLSLSAKWIQRTPKVFVECSCADIYSGADTFTTLEVQLGSSLTLTCKSHEGYELLNWVLNGVESVSANNPLHIEGIDGDKYVNIAYRFVSPSSGLIAVSDRGLPTITESSALVKVSELGGDIDTSGMIWRGHDSVPLIVDNYIYFRAGDRIYKAESDTGYIVASAPSVECGTFYHQIGYGDGVIVDSLTGRAYNMDLEQIFKLDRTFEGIDYYNGQFYSSGQDVYTFSSKDEQPGPDEVKRTRLLGKMERVYSSYGFSNSVFVDHYMYRVYAEGAYRGISALDLETGESVNYPFRSMDYVFLDDGWISYNDGYIYLPGYTSGLFGAQAKIGYSGFAYVKVDGLIFYKETEGHYEFNGKTGFVSEILFWGDKAYVVAQDTLYAFNIVNHRIDPNSVRTTSAVGGHGSISIDVSHAGEEGSPIYIYQIPYFSTTIKSMGIIEDRGGVLTSTIISNLPSDYNSQTVRPDVDGRMVWYNDSGHIFTYTVPEKNAYYFFIEDGNDAGWFVAYGENVYEAAKALGSVLSIDNTHSVSRIFGNAVSNATIYALDSEPNTLMEYNWANVDSFNNRDFDIDHYFIITTRNTESIRNTTYSYVGGTYTFQENIGDRSLIGTMMVSGTDVSIVRFTEDGKELTEYTSVGKNGINLNVIPRIVKEGYMPVWKLDGSVVDILSEKYSSDKEYKLEWMKIEQSIDSTVNSVTSKVNVVLVNVKDDEISSLNIVMNITYADNTMSRVETSKLELRDGKILVDFQYDSNKVVKDVMVYAEYNGIPICIDHPELA